MVLSLSGQVAKCSPNLSSQHGVGLPPGNQVEFMYMCFAWLFGLSTCTLRPGEVIAHMYGICAPFI